jgi:hypothetical protein
MGMLLLQKFIKKWLQSQIEAFKKLLNRSIIYVSSQWSKSICSKEMLAVLAVKLFDVGELPKMD